MSMLATYEPWNVLDQFRRNLDQLYGQSVERSNGDSTIATSTWVPAVDIKEEKQQFVIEADIPGIDPKDVEIYMENNTLTIKGERNLEKKEDQKYYKRVERLHGTFYRRFSLPDTADAENIKASGKNGILQVTIPKKEAAQLRKITIES